ncbi:DUF4279 domain-containing protein [Mesorhizobium sp.]|uniref:DUF4279 domain-containing protein n=1 Tax=Mesorhizobium sp. TaxID=1871066 RepID=UPI00257E8261|nr:DUF4279 domain-containing protein [Mesorhizobium sp.]
MSDIHETAAGLFILGDDLIPDEVTKLLGALPTVARVKGGQWFTPIGQSMISKTGVWRRHAERRTPGDINLQISEILEPLSKDRTVWQSLQRRFDVKMDCGLIMSDWNEGLEILPETMKQLADRGVRLELDVYGPMDATSD